MVEVPHCTRRLDVRGGFDLAQSASFGFGQRDAGSYDGAMRLAFCADGYEDQVGVVVRATGPAELTCDIWGEADPDVVAAQTARLLSVDVDGTGYDALGTRDPFVGTLQAARPGLRPPLFHSAYEAVAWSVLSSRRPHAQMATLRDAFSRAYGRVFELAGREVAALPTPRQLLEVTHFPGLPELKLRRLHGVAEAALAGVLDTERLRGLEPADAGAQLQQLEGIGPFYAELVTVRALGHTDVAPTAEPKVLRIAADLLGRAEPLTPPEFAGVAAAWTPWRTWVTVAARAAGPEVLAAKAAS